MTDNVILPLDESLGNSSQMSRVDLIAFDQPAASITDDSSAFTVIWDTMEGSGYDLRGWSHAKVEDLIKNLEASDGIRVNVIPAHEPPFYGT